MIPRYGPTYTYSDLLRAAAGGNGCDALRLALSRLDGARHVFLFDAARTALRALLTACGRGGEVVMPGYTCLVVPEAVAAAGCVPVFADVGKESVNMTAETLAKTISPRTTAVILTHQFGLPCDVHRILDICRRRGFMAIEDAAPAMGATVDGVPVGCFGDASLVSFYFTKTVSAGMGGALLTNDDDVARRVGTIAGPDLRPPRFSWLGAPAKAAAWKIATEPLLYGALRAARRLAGDENLFQVLPPAAPEPVQPFHGCPRYTAALCASQLDRLGGNVERRRHLAGIFEAELRDIPEIGLPRVEDGVLPAWIQYPVFLRRKADAYRCCLRRSVDLSWTFRYCAADSYAAAGCPNSRKAAERVLGLPTYPALPDASAYRICSVLKAYLAGAALQIAERAPAHSRTL